MEMKRNEPMLFDEAKFKHDIDVPMPSGSTHPTTGISTRRFPGLVIEGGHLGITLRADSQTPTFIPWGNVVFARGRKL